MDFIENLERVGKKVRFIRISKGIKQSDVARTIGVSQAHLSNIERGRNSITLENLFKLSEALDCTISEFFCDIKEKESKKDFSHEELQAILTIFSKMMVK